VLRLSLYALIGGLTSIDRERLMASFSARAPVRAAAGLLVALAAVLSLLRLSTIVPAMLSGVTPRELRDTGLATTRVNVLDLAAFLPTAMLAGVAHWNRRALGYALAPLVLTAMILIGVGIVSIQVVFAVRDLDAVWAVAVGITQLTIFELLVLARLFSVDCDDLRGALNACPADEVAGSS
jgi:hypothetical protein